MKFSLTKKILILTFIILALFSFGVSSVNAEVSHSECKDKASEGWVWEGGLLNGKCVQKTAQDDAEGSFIGRAFNWALAFSVYPVLGAIGALLLTFTSLLVWIAGGIMDLVIQVSVIDMAKYVNDLEAIKVGWGLFRDVVNMFLIFILLYISIRTIIGVGNFDPKRMIKNVIMVALFINFSLFATRLVIDTSNILAVGMYNNIKTSVAAGAKDEATKLKAEKNSVSMAFMSPIWATSFFYTKQTEEEKSGLSSFLGTIDAFANREVRTIVATFIGSIFFLVISFVFFAAAFMFVTRFIILIFLMVLSPVAFGSLAFPGLSHWWGQWFDKLIKHSFFAPLFLFMMYFVAYFLNNNDVKDADANFGVMLNIIIAVGLMLMALILSNKFSIAGSNMARNLAGSATIGLSAWAGRRVVGRAGSVVAESKYVRELIASDSGLSKFAGRRLKSVGDFASKGTFDLRGAPGAGDVAKFGGGMGSISKGAKGGFDQWKKDQAKRVEEEKKFVQGLSPEESEEIAGQNVGLKTRAKNEAEDELKEKDKLVAEFTDANEEIKEIKALKKEIEDKKAERKEELEDLLKLAIQSGNEAKTLQTRQKIRSEMAVFDQDIKKEDEKIKSIVDTYKGTISYEDTTRALSDAKEVLKQAEGVVKDLKKATTARRDRYVGRYVIEDGKIVNKDAGGEESTGLSKRTFASTLFGTTRMQREQAMKFLSPEYEDEQKQEKERKKLADLLKKEVDSGKKSDEDKKSETKPAEGGEKTK